MSNIINILSELGSNSLLSDNSNLNVFLKQADVSKSERFALFSCDSMYLAEMLDIPKDVKCFPIILPEIEQLAESYTNQAAINY